MNKDIHENSILSYKEYKEKGTQEAYRYRIWLLLKTNSVPMTDREVMEWFNEIDPNNVRPEITRLKQDGLVIEVGKTKCPFTKKKVRCSTATNLEYFPRNFKKNISQGKNGQLLFL